MTEVFVAGSINQDFVLRVERRPQPGETVTNADLMLYAGGKGANQAVASARLGASVDFLGRVGDDPFGGPLVSRLRTEGVGVGLIETIAEEPTGSAFITVTPDGENAITVAPGANCRLSLNDVEDARETIRESEILVAQMEIPLGVVERAVEVAAAEGTRPLLNLAPSFELSSAILQRLDPLVVNEHEAAFLLGSPVEGVKDALHAAPELLALGARSVVITQGSAGAVYADSTDSGHLPAPEVQVVDTTGAGDAFVGALAATLAREKHLKTAVSYAVRAGAAAVTKKGAQSALPIPEVMEAL